MMKNIEMIKAYWMATMAMGETREEMEEIWSTEDGMQDLTDWFDGELELGITEDEMMETIKAVEDQKAEEEKKMAKANDMVQVIEIEVEGIKYTQTRPGYYYKRVDGKNVRISKSEWEQAFDAFTAEVNEADEEFDAEDEIRARKEAEEQKDRETEKNFNNKKAAKPRRSKDVAFEMDTIEGHITLTAKQVQFLKLLPKTCFWEEGLESTLWCDILADEIGGQFAGKPMAVGAMISTLREKGLVSVGKDLDRKGKPKFMVLTEVGKQVAKELGLN